MKTTLYNGKVVLRHDIIRHGGVQVESGRITRVFSGAPPDGEGEKIDCRGQYIAPGFIDVHTHGVMGGDTMDATPEALEKMAKLHADHGTTAIYPSTLSQSRERIMRALTNVAGAMKRPPAGARILGAHMESNYFAPVMAGAQNPAYLYAPRESEYMSYIETGCVRRVSAAPELEGALDMPKKLKGMGVQFSIGHSNGTPKDVENAVHAGYTSLTHIFNAQSALRSVFCYPEFGVCEAALLHDELFVECICDGNHLSPTMLKFIYKVKGSRGMVGVTDAVFAGAPEGSYTMGGLDVKVVDNVCVLQNGKAFAGSVATMDLCVRTLYQKAGICLADAVAICSDSPARLMGLQDRGCLREGFMADVVVFDEDIGVLLTMVEGEIHKNTL